MITPPLQQSNLDPQVVAMAKAIRDTETGNQPKQGASGEYKSRYQFMPDTWKAAAKQYLGNENAALTLNNENYVAYQRIKTWKDKGYNPGQIASMWNSGSPDPSGKVGTNSKGVKYDTPAYVKAVYANYQKYKPQGQTNQNNQVTQKGDPNYKPVADSNLPTTTGGVIQNEIGSGISSYLKQNNPLNPLLGTQTGQNIVKGAVKMGAQSFKPFLTPFAMTAGKDINLPGVGKVSANPTPGQALGLGVEAGLDALGLEGGAAVESAIPEAKTAAEKALNLTTDELAKVDKRKLEFLSKEAMEQAKTTGLFKKTYAMVDEVKKLANEFGHILTGKNPEENLALAEKEGLRLENEARSVVKNNNKMLNTAQFKNALKESINGIKDSVYRMASKDQKAALSEGAISDFMSYVKKGTLEGIDQAREAFRAANVGSDETLNKANDAIYKGVKKFIEDSLPEEERTVYREAKQAQAKLFDIREILRAKKAATIGKLTPLGNVAKTAGGIAAGVLGGEAIYKGAKKIGIPLP